MRKIIIAVLSYSMLACVTVLVEGSVLDMAYATTLPQHEKVKIKKEELPEATRNTLSGDAFKGWTVEKSYKLTSGGFEVDLKKGDTVQTLKFDKDGKLK